MAGTSGQHCPPSRGGGVPEPGVRTDTDTQRHFQWFPFPRRVRALKTDFHSTFIFCDCETSIVPSWIPLVPSSLSPRNRLQTKAASAGLTQRVEVSGRFWASLESWRPRRALPSVPHLSRDVSINVTFVQCIYLHCREGPCPTFSSGGEVGGISLSGRMPGRGVQAEPSLGGLS